MHGALKFVWDNAGIIVPICLYLSWVPFLLNRGWIPFGLDKGLSGVYEWVTWVVPFYYYLW